MRLIGILVLLTIVSGSAYKIPTQVKFTEGTIAYDYTTQTKMNVGGQELSQKMNMYTVIDFSGGYYKLTISVQTSGSGSTGINIPGGMQMFGYYDPHDKRIYQIVESKGTKYAIVQPNRKINGFSKTGKSEVIAGFTCEEFTGQLNGNTATGWFTDELPAAISPLGNLELPGALIKFTSADIVIEMKSILNSTDLKEADIRFPKNVKKVSREEFNALK